MPFLIRNSLFFAKMSHFFHLVWPQAHICNCSFDCLWITLRNHICGFFFCLTIPSNLLWRRMISILKLDNLKHQLNCVIFLVSPPSFFYCDIFFLKVFSFIRSKLWEVFLMAHGLLWIMYFCAKNCLCFIWCLQVNKHLCWQFFVLSPGEKWHEISNLGTTSLYYSLSKIDHRQQ